jgi:hypothetical protein
MNEVSRRRNAALKENGFSMYGKTLQSYKYVDELHDLRDGGYVRWIHLNRRTLTNGAFLLNVDIRDDGIYLLMKTGNGRILSIWADECLIFQKISDDERLMLRASQYL